MLELAVPAWHSGLTLADKGDIERVQKAALQIILGMNYRTYSTASKWFELDTLEQRRTELCGKFANKAVKNTKHTNWFKLNDRTTITRKEQPKYCPVRTRTKRYEKSPLSYLTSLLNN